LKNKCYILGIDGGGTNTYAVIFDEEGKTIANCVSSGTNLNVYKELAIKRIIDLIKTISYKAKLTLDDISGYGIALAGVSDLNQREGLLKELDALNISSNSIVLSDTEAAYKLLCPSGNGVLLSVGTGVVVMGKKDKKIIKVAGKGHDKGDLGSGYWMGKQVIKNLLINANIVEFDNDLLELFNIVKQKFNINDIGSINEFLEENDNAISDVASISSELITLAKGGNDIALSIVQEATTYIADYIIHVFNSLEYDKISVIVACNGSIIKNNFYRRLLSDALQFDFKEVHWIFSNLSAAYGAGLIIAEVNNIEVLLTDIIEGI